MLPELGSPFRPPQHAEARDTLSKAHVLLLINPHFRDSIDGQVQRARIKRDIGADHLRTLAWSNLSGHVMGVQTEEQLMQVQRFTDASMKLLDTAHNLAEGDTYAAQRPRDAKPVAQAALISEILAEQAATIGQVGRTATTEMVLTGVNMPDTAYETAHELALEGPNGYYQVSNAVNAARHNRIAGDSGEALRWMRLALHALAWTGEHDPDNLHAAQRTFAAHSLALRSVGAAKASVLSRP